MKFHLEKTSILSILLFLVFSSPTLKGQEYPEPLSPPRMVNDYIGLLDSQQFEMLEGKLRRYRDTTSNEVSVVIIESIGQDDIDLYGAELAEKWGVGKEGKENGILLLVALNDRKVSISTGYGLEGVIPDAYAKRIIEKYIIPNFKNERYFQGIDQATSIMMSLASGEFKGDPQSSKSFPGFLVLILVLTFIFFPLLSARRAKRRHFSSKPVDFWTAFWLASALGRGRGSTFKDFRGGGGSFGGGSSFGGFGGGSFGGGGASGSW